MQGSRLAAILALLAMLCLSPAVFGQSPQDTEEVPAAPLSPWQAQLDGISEKLAAPEVPDQDLSELREELEGIRREARALIAEMTPRVQAAHTELEALGPSPAEGEEPEPPGVAAQRADLRAKLAEVEGPVKEAELAVGRATRLISELAEARRKRFAERILSKGPPPFSPAIWQRALPEMAWIAQTMTQSAVRIISSAQFKDQLRESALVLGVALALAIVLVWPVYNWLLRHYGRDPSIARPSFMEALRATLVVGAARAILPTAAAALLYIVVVTERLVTETGQGIAQAIFLGFLLFTWSIAFFRASLSPLQPAWRIVPVPTNFARGLRGIIVGIALAFAIDIVLSEVIVAFGARLAITALRDYGLALFLSGFLLLLLLRQQMWIPEAKPGAKPRWRTLRILIAIVLIVLLVLGAFGYVTLARFVVTQLVLTGGLILIVLVLHRLGREFISQAVSPETWVGERLRVSLRIDEESAGRLQFWAGASYDFILILLGLVVGLFLWGADRKDVAEWAYQALFGFRIGEITISLVDFLVALAVFSGLVLITRLIQRALSEKVLPQTQLDPGIRESIRIATGYLGIVIAAAAGISALGLDLSNLAIIAGALSVGIGFGLQNVVNNFVSGLILLIERPVKVGDWIVVGDKQGYVKRIKVRATEIQTFDRATLFIPNSQLIAEAVTNWTYADKMGRVIIPVGVAYGSDTRKVREVLFNIAHSHPEVLRHPEPLVAFRRFGDSSLEFELRCFLKDVERTISVGSDLCFAIDDEFRKAGIEIPFPRQDIYVKQLATTAEERDTRASETPTLS